MTSNRNALTGTATLFQKACAVLCLLLLAFSAAHVALGHNDLPLPLSTHGHAAQMDRQQSIAAVPIDTADTCVLCAAFASALPLLLFFFGLAAPTPSKPPLVLCDAAPLTGWHASLACRPPPAC